ncbi:MAG: hypothetical protein IT495_10040 [Gammaproteobacteria bacterium]|nr:hypothetical protein [Gammaproteobacteria bacterium]
MTTKRKPKIPADVQRLTAEQRAFEIIRLREQVATLRETTAKQAADYVRLWNDAERSDRMIGAFFDGAIVPPEAERTIRRTRSSAAASAKHEHDAERWRAARDYCERAYRQELDVRDGAHQPGAFARLLKDDQHPAPDTPELPPQATITRWLAEIAPPAARRRGAPKR